MNPKVSVIIPVYNTDKYLSRCVESVISQPLQNLEVILVDDGSNDCSASICDEFAEKDARIHVFHKENGGVSSARNLGIDKAKGSYISFVDSDDWFDEGAIPLDLFEEEYDVIQIPRSRGSFYKKYEANILCSTRKETVSFLDNNFYNECWGRFYKRSVIGDSRFDTNIRMGEDILFLVRIYDNIKTYFVLGGSKGYNYFENAESASAKLGYYTDLDELTDILHKIAKINNSRLAWRFLLIQCCNLHKNRGSYKRFISEFDYFELKRVPIDGGITGQLIYDKKKFIKEDIFLRLQKLKAF